MSAYARGVAHVAAHAACLVVLAACAASPPDGGRQPDGPSAPAPPSVAPTDASFDWRGLVLVPFGTRLVDSPVPLHEVLLFHDEARGPAEADNRDCYAVDGTPPRFMGRPAEEYLLCFGHDRLNRIDASVQLATADAADTFARSCARWLQDSVSPTPPAMPAGDACQGRQGGISWSARLAALPDAPTMAVSMTLAVAAEREPPAAAGSGAIGAIGAVDALSAAP